MNRRRIARLAFSLAASFLAGELGSAQGTPVTPMLSQSELDATIDALPPVGAESTYDLRTAQRVSEPPVARLRAHIEAGGKLTDEQWQRALLPAHALHSRARWPVDRPFAVTMGVPEWLPEASEIDAFCEREDWKPARARSQPSHRCGLGFAMERDRMEYEELGPLPLGAHELRFQVVVECSSAAFSPLWTGELRLETEIVPTLDQALAPVHDATVEAAVRLAFVASVYTYTIHDDVQVGLGVDWRGVPELASIAASFTVELVEDGARVKESTHFYIPDRSGYVAPRSLVWQWPGTKAELSRWSLRIRGDTRDVLRSWKADSYWDGEIVIPTVDLPRR